MSNYKQKKMKEAKEKTEKDEKVRVIVYGSLLILGMLTYFAYNWIVSDILFGI